SSRTLRAPQGSLAWSQRWSSKSSLQRVTAVGLASREVAASPRPGTNFLRGRRDRQDLFPGEHWHEHGHRLQPLGSDGLAECSCQRLERKCAVETPPTLGPHLQLPLGAEGHLKFRGTRSNQAGPRFVQLRGTLEVQSELDNRPAHLRL